MAARREAPRQKPSLHKGVQDCFYAMEGSRLISYMLEEPNSATVRDASHVTHIEVTAVCTIRRQVS
jgi:hypothetical protein